MFKVIFFHILVFILLNPNELKAHELTLKEEFGQTTLGTIFEEEEDDARFSFWKTTLGFSSGDEKARLNLKGNHRERNFKNRDSDYSANSWELRAWRKSPVAEDSIRWGGKILWRDRDYKDFSLSSFRKLRGSLFAEDFRGFSAQVVSSFYDYTARQEDKIAGSVKKEIGFRNLDLAGALKGEYHTAKNQNRLRWKKELDVRIQWKPQLNYWVQSALNLEMGQRDTKELEEREDDIDFSFWNINLKNTHPLGPQHELSWSIAFYEKDDKGGLFSHRGASLEWNPSWKPGFGDFPIKLEGILKFKNMKFRERPLLNYEKQTFGFRSSLVCWGKWKTQAELTQDFYSFPNQKDRTQRTNAKVSFERKIFQDLRINLATRLRNTLLVFDGGLTLEF